MCMMFTLVNETRLAIHTWVVERALMLIIIIISELATNIFSTYLSYLFALIMGNIIISTLIITVLVIAMRYFDIQADSITWKEKS